MSNTSVIIECLLLLSVHTSGFIQMNMSETAPEIQELYGPETSRKEGDHREMEMLNHLLHYNPHPPSKPPLGPTFFNSRPSPERPTVHHAGLPRKVAVTPLELLGGDHELMFNVTWIPPVYGPVSDYSIEVISVTESGECKTQMCYEYNIPGDAFWWIIPSQINTVAGSCSIRPGCSYSVKLIPHPWDGHTAANIDLRLDQCVVNVCSCAYAAQLPVPEVSANTVSVGGELMANVTWSLPAERAARLPKGLQKAGYLVSIGKQMVTDAHPVPWFGYTSNHKVDTSGPISSGDKERTALIPVSERLGRSDGDDGKRNLVLDVKLIARVRLLDSRNCVGPSGNATAYDPHEAENRQSSPYLVWAALGALSVLMMVFLIMIGSRGVKKVLSIFRSNTVTGPLEPLRNHPVWLPLQIRT